MYIWKANKKRCNHYAPYTDEQGTRHTRVPPDLYEEIADPVRESDETHYVQEIDEYPYVINTPKPPEMLEAARIAKLDQEILSLEKQAIEQGLIRTIIDDLLIRSLTIAAQAGVTEAQLLDPESEHYSKAFAKVHGNAAARAVLRAQR